VGGTIHAASQPFPHFRERNCHTSHIRRRLPRMGRHLIGRGPAWERPRRPWPLGAQVKPGPVASASAACWPPGCTTATIYAHGIRQQIGSLMASANVQCSQVACRGSRLPSTTCCPALAEEQARDALDSELERISAESIVNARRVVIGKELLGPLRLPGPDRTSHRWGEIECSTSSSRSSMRILISQIM
jgi:hypothetical protein